MERGKLVIFGTGMMGGFVAEHFVEASPWRVVAFTAHQRFIEAATFEGLPVVPFETILDVYPPSEYTMFIALSYGNVNRTRRQVYLEVKALGYACASFVSPDMRSLKPVVHGDNVFINESTFQPRVRIGNNVHIMSNNLIGHDVTIGDHCFISSGVVISGNTTVGESCFFGVNSCCRENLVIADRTVLGAGVTLLRNSKPNTAYIAPQPTVMPLDPEGKDFLVRPKFPSSPSA